MQWQRWQQQQQLKQQNRQQSSLPLPHQQHNHRPGHDSDGVDMLYLVVRLFPPSLPAPAVRCEQTAIGVAKLKLCNCMATNVLFLLKNNYMFIAKTNNIHNDLIISMCCVYGSMCAAWTVLILWIATTNQWPFEA